MSVVSQSAKFLLSIVGRILFAAAFVIPGVNNIYFFEKIFNLMSQVPSAKLVLILTICLQLLGGVLVILGIRLRFGAILLLIAVILMGWTEILTPSGINLDFQSIMRSLMLLADNIGLAGGAIYIIAFGKGCREKHVQV